MNIIPSVSAVEWIFGRDALV